MNHLQFSAPQPKRSTQDPRDPDVMISRTPKDFYQEIFSRQNLSFDAKVTICMEYAKTKVSLHIMDSAYRIQMEWKREYLYRETGQIVDSILLSYKLKRNFYD